MRRVPHAIEQALARYGLRLSHEDLLTLCKSCMEGYGRLRFEHGGTEKHIATIHGKQIVLIYAPPGTDARSGPYGKIVTILPIEEASPTKWHIKPPRKDQKGTISKKKRRAKEWPSKLGR